MRVLDMLRDENIFLYVMDEIEGGTKNEALWTKAFAMSEGDHNKNRALYLQYRVSEIKYNLNKHEIDFNGLSKDAIGEYISNNFYYNDNTKCLEKLFEWADDHDLINLRRNTGFPNSIKQLKEMSRLDIQSQDLSIIPKEIGCLTDLRILSLDQCQLSKVPSEIRNMKKLEKLVLSTNHLTVFPEELNTLKTLKVLNLGINNIKEFPKVITKFTSLTSLNLWMNHIPSIPPEISNLKNLVSLDLTGCELKNVPKEIALLPNLKVLKLGGYYEPKVCDAWNNFTELPEEIIGLKKLTHLEIGGVKLTQKQKEWIRYLRSNGCITEMRQF